MRNYIRIQFAFTYFLTYALPKPCFLEIRVMRKSPQQQRSKQMVNTLLEATAKCIALRGDLITPARPRLQKLQVSVLARCINILIAKRLY